MGFPAERILMSVEEYLEFSAEAEMRHEFINGEAIAMAGGTPAHAALSMNLGVALGIRLRGKPCRPTSNDQRVKVESTGAFFYPDLTVVCGDYQLADDDPLSVTNPAVVFEVLSPSTEGYDRGVKLEHYRRIPSLRDCLFVHQDERRIVGYTRQEDGSWVLRETTEGSLRLASLGVELPLDEIYDLEGVPAP